MNALSYIEFRKQTEVAREDGSERTSDGAVLKPHERAGLLKLLEVSFGLYELKSLALFLGADYSLFSHVQKNPLVLDLLCYCERREQLGLLIAKMMQQRPRDPFLASLLAKLPPALPRKKAQLVLSSEHGSRLNRREMERALAEFFGVPQEQVAIMGVADGTFRLLVSLPHGTACPQVRLGSHKLCKGKYEIFFVTPLDALEQASQRTWRMIVLNHPPKQGSTALRPAVSWQQAAQARESDVSSSPSTSAVPDRAQAPGSRFLPRIPIDKSVKVRINGSRRLPSPSKSTVHKIVNLAPSAEPNLWNLTDFSTRAALWIALLVVFCIAVFVAFAAQNANRRSGTAPQVAFVKETTTAIELETVDAQMPIAETATVVAMPSITPSSTVASTPTALPTHTPQPTHTPRPTLTPTVTHTPRPTLTPTVTHTPQPTLTPTVTPTVTPIVTPTPEPRYRLVQQSRICPAIPDSEASGGQVSGGQVRITVLDQEGEQQPNVELLLRWSEGEDRAFTGLKPEIGVGYADFVVAAGQSYQVAMIGIESDVAQGIVVDECIGESMEKGQIASWEIVFQLSSIAL
jgi:hypothetical protein